MQSTRRSFLQRSGVYRISSRRSPSRIYIGSAINIGRRWHQHRDRLRRQCHHSIKLQRHFDKYGEADLLFEVIAWCDPPQLLQTEQAQLDKLRPYFNCDMRAGSRLGTKHSAETCAKISRAKKGNKYWVGKQHTDESKQKMREAKLGCKLSAARCRGISKRMAGNTYAAGNKNRLGKTFSEESRRKISLGVRRYFKKLKAAGKDSKCTASTASPISE